MTRTHVCIQWILTTFLLKLGEGITNKEIFHLTQHALTIGKQKTESADSSLGLSNGHGGSRDINPAFDSQSQDEVIT